MSKQNFHFAGVWPSSIIDRRGIVRIDYLRSIEILPREYKLASRRFVQRSFAAEAFVVRPSKSTSAYKTYVCL